MVLPTSTPRLHRLPRRTDYILIPAPLNLSLSEATEKSALPAIIVTPSSPSSSRDFSIAFLAAPPKPSIRERIASWRHYGGPFSLRIRSILIVLFIIFGLVCHLAAHRLAGQRPYLDSSTQTGGDIRMLDSPMGWIDFRPLFGDKAASVHLDFIINEPYGSR
ncbi:hypothetical protein BYT27DRAFT_6397322 [Phlegmacium glaucopus]|nr:hypothetical protein BYT27DRAFT_6397322 [Phlegmacium glaucopus]